MSTIIELDIAAITEESVARAIVTLIVELPGFDPKQYDLNQRGNPRAWDTERAIVDLLTQRTQLFVVDGDQAQILVATGKHGEPPTVAISLDVSPVVLAELLHGLPVRAIHHD